MQCLFGLSNESKCCKAVIVHLHGLWLSFLELQKSKLWPLDDELVEVKSEDTLSYMCLHKETFYVWPLRNWVKKKSLDITKYKIRGLVYVQMIGTSITYWGWNWESTHLVLCSKSFRYAPIHVHVHFLIWFFGCLRPKHDKDSVFHAVQSIVNF